jgi:deoxyadenosine/deoxycytidine kinase
MSLIDGHGEYGTNYEYAYDNLRNGIIPLLYEIKSQLELAIYNDSDLETIKNRLHGLHIEISNIERKLYL